MGYNEHIPMPFKFLALLHGNVLVKTPISPVCFASLLEVSSNIVTVETGVTVKTGVTADSRD